MSEQKTILLVDGSNLVFRMYFALERTGMTSPSGKPSWAIFGFFKALLDVIEKEQPTTVVAAFDTKGPTFRHQAFDFYKANRPTEMPDPMKSQWPEIKRGIQLIGMSMIEMPGFEADDLIGTLALQAENSGWKVLILSGDRDNFQLVNEHVKILMPGQMGGIQMVGTEEVKIKMGVRPDQVVDFKSLCGDSSDNIPGVPGIGEKTAVKLLEEFDTLENIYSNLDKISSQSVRKKLEEGRDSAKDSQYLAQIRTDCTITYEFEKLIHALQPDLEKLKDFLHEYKLVSLEKRLPKIFKAFGSQDIEQLSFTAGVSKARVSRQDQFNTDNDDDLSFPAAEFEAKKQAIDSAKEQIKVRSKTIFSEADLQALKLELQNAKKLSLDLETNGLDTFECNIVGWALSFKSTKDDELEAVYIPTQHNYLGAPKQLTNQFVAKLIADFLQTWPGQLVVQNTKFEYKILKRYGITLPANTQDTMLASYLQNPDAAHGLKAQAFRIFNYQMTEIEDIIGVKGKKQKTMDQMPIEQVATYACDDAAMTLALYEHYQQNLDPKLKTIWTEIESPMAILLAEIELKGVFVNASKLETLSKELSRQIVIFENQILADLDTGTINLNSSQQLGKALDAKGFKLSKTGTGQLSTDIKNLQELKDKDESGLIGKIIDYRVLTKLRSTYTDSLAKEIKPATGRVHCDFNQALTSTGRLSSSNPNLQNIPVKNQEFGKLIRASFEAEPGNILISADYSQIELRLLAHYTEDPTLLDAFRSGQDIHLRTASEIFEVPLEGVTSDMRRLGKTLNFALIYQQGTFATARQLGISNKQASEFIEKYFLSFPKVRPFMDAVLTQARSNGYVETIWGRRRYFKNLNSSAAMLRKAEERAAFNAPLQGSAADMMKIAMLRVSEKLTERKLNSQIVLQVHDEIVLEAPQEYAKEACEILRSEMVIGQPLKVPIEIGVGKGPNWAECK
jgi:DNA polymerase I